MICMQISNSGHQITVMCDLHVKEMYILVSLGRAIYSVTATVQTSMQVVCRFHIPAKGGTSILGERVTKEKFGQILPISP